MEIGTLDHPLQIKKGSHVKIPRTPPQNAGCISAGARHVYGERVELSTNFERHYIPEVKGSCSCENQLVAIISVDYTAKKEFKNLKNVKFYVFLRSKLILFC